MKMLIEVLVDVSRSMKDSLQLNVNLQDQHITRGQSIFSTIINVSKGTVTHKDSQEIFVLAFGLKATATCDLLSLLDHIRTLNNELNVNNGRESLIQLLARNGAPFASDYIYEHVSEKEAALIFKIYSRNERLLREHIGALPAPYKELVTSVNYFSLRKAASIISQILGSSTIENELRDKVKQVVRKHVEQAIQSYNESKIREMSRPMKRSSEFVTSLLLDVASLLSSSTSTSQTAQLSSLVNFIEPYIYGNTPMCEALEYASNTFHYSDQNRKVLFLFSSGESTDGDPATFADQFRSNNVLVSVCLLTSKNISHPRRLYDKPDSTWTKAQIDMFKLSSTIENTRSAMSFLLQRNWELPASGQSRLFIQANDPDVINEFCSLVRHIAESDDAVVSIFGSVLLDLYITAGSLAVRAKRQIGGTCYANAVATVFYFAMCRIVGRDGGVPDFFEIRQKLIQEYGSLGAKTERVLNVWAPKYRLQYKKVDQLGATRAINARRPVVATFALYPEQWTAFSKFYHQNKDGILQIDHLVMHSSENERQGHAVVLIKCDPDSLTFMNSWGVDFADEGFFKVKDQYVLNLTFYDVYWTLDDLRDSEIAKFQSRSREVGQNIIQNLPECIKNLPYKCPKCDQCSPAIAFARHFWNTTCPICNRSFQPKTKENSLTTKLFLFFFLQREEL